MHYPDKDTNIETWPLRTLLEPSWLSGLIAVVGTVVIIIGAMIAASLQGSTLQQALFTVQNSSATSYQQLTSKLSSNAFISNLPLLLFWLFVGFIVYYFAAAIYNAFHEAVELEQELSYVHAQRQKLLRQASVHLIIRILALAAWFLYIRLFLQRLLPYVLATANQAATNTSVSSFLQLLLAAASLMVGFHIHTIFLRLVMLRQRVFQS